MAYIIRDLSKQTCKDFLAIIVCFCFGIPRRLNVLKFILGQIPRITSTLQYTAKPLDS